ncbi:MAG: ParA family protein [Candidatus Planktophila sp.]
MNPAVIVLANTSGGSGKTTLAHGLSVAMVEFGKRTLLIDCDPRASLTFRVGREGQRLTIADFLSGSTVRIEDLESTEERFDFIAADARIGYGFQSQDLQNFINVLPKSYDVIIIDTPSDINSGLIASLAVADLILVPYMQTLHHMRGVAQINSLVLDQTIKLLQIGNDSVHAGEFRKWEHLDSGCDCADEIEIAQESTTSVLTVAKNSPISSQIRECAYSALEILGMD